MKIYLGQKAYLYESLVSYALATIGWFFMEIFSMILIVTSYHNVYMVLFVSLIFSPAGFLYVHRLLTYKPIWEDGKDGSFLKSDHVKISKRMKTFIVLFGYFCAVVLFLLFFLKIYDGDLTPAGVFILLISSSIFALPYFFVWCVYVTREYVARLEIHDDGITLTIASTILRFPWKSLKTVRGGGEQLVFLFNRNESRNSLVLIGLSREENYEIMDTGQSIIRELRKNNSQ